MGLFDKDLTESKEVQGAKKWVPHTPECEGLATKVWDFFRIQQVQDIIHLTWEGGCKFRGH